MCGLVGIYGKGDISQMMSKIKHRGPDGSGVKTFGNLTFGHVRLAIQDLDSRAAQPMTVDGTTIIYNGEAWNVKNLREEFKNRKWNTTSDTEPIAALLARDGVQALNKIDGMFALAWHNNSGIFLARDRYGKIPLYIAKDDKNIFFASEIKALPKALKAKAILPGHVLNLLNMEQVKWITKTKPDVCTPENVLRFLKHGVEQRLLSDRPVCFLLSGGLDSSLVLAIARELHPEPVAYTAVLDPQSPDLIAARKIAKELDVPLQEVQVSPPTLEQIHAAITTVENPMKAQIEIALIHMPLMKAIASDGFRVTLSGEAADELFCGYGNMQIAASKTETDMEYQQILRNTVAKMSRGNFMRVNKVMMSAGVEGRLPFMEERLVATALQATKNMNPPNKKVLKAAAQGLLPKWLINRPKQTFQGGSGMSKAVQSLGINPVRYYNSVALHEFGWRPTE